MPFVPIQHHNTSNKFDTCPPGSCNPTTSCPCFISSSCAHLTPTSLVLPTPASPPRPVLVRLAVGEAIRTDLASLFPNNCYNLATTHCLLPRPSSQPRPKMNGTTEPATEASAATQTTETVKMNGTSTTDAGLFGDELISPEVAKALPEGYKIRALRQSDFKAGFLDCLRVLTTVGDITEEAFAERFAWLSRQDGGYYILVIEDGGRVVGTGALIVERKLYVASLSPFRDIVSIAQWRKQSERWGSSEPDQSGSTSAPASKI